MIDCLIIGFNDSDFENYVRMVRSMGVDSGAYKDLALAFIKYNDKPYRALDILTHFQPEDDVRYHNTDFLWPTISYLGSYLARRNFSFDYVNSFQLEKPKLRDKLRQNNILTIAITTTLYVSPHPILEIISFIRQHNDTAKIIVGGPYISNLSSEDADALADIFRYMDADLYVISQEGELALVNVLRALKNGIALDGIDNIAYKKEDSYVMTSRSTESNSLEDDMVDYTLFPKPEIGEFLSLRTAKSCPFSCSFCGFPTRAGKYTYLSVDLVEKELNAIQDQGMVTTLSFLDDTFNVPKKRFKEILQMMIRNKYNFKWNCFYRSDHGDEETIALMKEAGCEGVFLGTESGSDVMLERMNKSARRKDYLKAIPLLRQAEITTYSSMIVGFPGETDQTIQETIDLLEEARPEFFRGQLWYADPMTPVWSKKEEYGIRGAGFSWSHDTMDSKTACAWVDKMFLSVKNSLWLPQWGFELWSIFYLQRKGMTKQQVKTFISCFDGVVRDQLVNPGKKYVEPELLERLKESCQFNKSAPDAQRPLSAGRSQASLAVKDKAPVQ
jgi:radical SAM PhpK family P-methyltransferase